MTASTDRMMRTTVYLPEELKRRLERRASRDGCSEAELIRQAVAQLLDAGAHPARAA